jgi:hypothetical protein
LSDELIETGGETDTKSAYQSDRIGKLLRFIETIVEKEAGNERVEAN